MFLGYQNCPTYFAAANSYHGFVSFFKEIFKPEKFTKTVILKGGPGTGKSSFMKEAAKRFCKEGFLTELILCSSDSDSLDGVIARKGEISFAILDGTAPHMQDPIYPGSHDTIFNFAPFWNERILMHSRNEIESLVKKKKAAYEAGYDKLSLCKAIDTYISAEYFKASNHEKIDSYIIKHFSDAPESDHEPKFLLGRAFGKNGYEEIPRSLSGFEKRCLFKGERRAVRVFVGEALKAIGSRKIVCFCPSPEVPTEFDGFAVGNTYYGFVEHDGESIKPFFHIDFSDSEEEKAILAFEKEAKAEFAFAAQCHAQLEQIYRNAMNFSLIDEAREELLTSLLKSENIETNG